MGKKDKKSCKHSKIVVEFVWLSDYTMYLKKNLVDE